MDQLIITVFDNNGTEVYRGTTTPGQLEESYTILDNLKIRHIVSIPKGIAHLKIWNSQNNLVLRQPLTDKELSAFYRASQEDEPEVDENLNDSERVTFEELDFGDIPDPIPVPADITVEPEDIEPEEIESEPEPLALPTPAVTNQPKKGSGRWAILAGALIFISTCCCFFIFWGFMAAHSH